MMYSGPSRLTAQSQLLVCPGWADDGRDQYSSLSALLSPLGWESRRSNLPDADWDPAVRARVTPSQALQLAAADFEALFQPASSAKPRRKVAVLGFSFGAYIAAHLTAVREV